MGANSTKICQILDKSAINPNLISQKNLKIECKFDYIEDSDKEKNLSSEKKEGENEENSDGSFDLSFEEAEELDNPKFNVKNLKKFPYSTIGTISVKFPIRKEVFTYTCFLIDTNVVVTLASNLECQSKGGKAKSIITSFSKEKVKWDNIFIQGEEKTKEKKRKEDRNQLDSLDNYLSKLAVIVYDDCISREWLGAEGGKMDDFEGSEKFVVFSFNEEKNSNNIILDEKDNNNQPKLREIPVHKKNPFFELYKKEEKKDVELINQSPGSPLFYKDCNSCIYSIAIINENYEIQYFDRETMIFLINMVNKGKLLRKKIYKEIDEDNIIQLDLKANNFGPSDIKFLCKYTFRNLRILDLDSNSIKSTGALYLSKGNFHALESLNLNNNKIGDEGLNHIANGFFSKLNTLHLAHNSITSLGIQYLVKAEFINNLIILSLSNNKKIGDTGVRYMKEHKKWENLSTLNLDHTGLSDVALDYLGKTSMPKIKEINIRNNKFSKYGQANINALKMNHIVVNYQNRDESENKISIGDYTISQ